MAPRRIVLIGGGTARTAPAVISAFLTAGYGVTVTGRDPDRLRAGAGGDSRWRGGPCDHGGLGRAG